MDRLKSWFKAVPNTVKITVSLLTAATGLLAAVNSILPYILPKPEEVILEKFDVSAHNEAGYEYTYPKNEKPTILH